MEAHVTERKERTLSFDVPALVHLDAIAVCKVANEEQKKKNNQMLKFFFVHV